MEPNLSSTDDALSGTRLLVDARKREGHCYNVSLVQPFRFYISSTEQKSPGAQGFLGVMMEAEG